MQRSLDTYVEFFKGHRPVNDIDPQQDRLLWSRPPVFILDLVEVEGGWGGAGRAAGLQGRVQKCRRALQTDGQTGTDIGGCIHVLRACALIACLPCALLRRPWVQAHVPGV